MARNRPTVRTATTFTAPQVAFFDLGTTIKLTVRMRWLDVPGDLTRIAIDLDKDAGASRLRVT